MYKFEKKFLFITVAVAVFLILLGVLIYFSIFKSSVEEVPPSEEEIMKERFESLSTPSVEEREDISPGEFENLLKDLSTPKK